jgi:hypothetical protein
MSYDSWKAFDPMEEDLGDAEQAQRVSPSIVTEGVGPLKFWVRMFALEELVERGNGLIGQRSERWAVPVVGEYLVSKDLLWLYVLVLEFDVLGLSGGLGIVYWADSGNSRRVRADRDKEARLILGEMEKWPPAEIAERESLL